MQKWIILIIVALIAIIGIFIVFNVKIETEYIPESEVEESEMRNTIVSLYFFEKETGEVIEENRLVDSKELLKNPYKVLIEMLIKGPENEYYEKTIADNTNLIDVSFEKGMVTLNFSKEFIENIEKEEIQKNKIVILKTLTQLTEVTDVKIMVEGVDIEI